MIPMCWWILLSITLALRFLHPSDMTIMEEDEAASISSLCTSLSDVMLVSLDKTWNEKNTFFARLVGGPLTTWQATNEALRSYFWRIVFRGKRPVCVHTEHDNTFEPFRASWDGELFPCSTWLSAKPYSNIPTQLSIPWPPRFSCDSVAIIGMNLTNIHSIFWPLESYTDRRPRSKTMLEKLRLVQDASPKTLGGKHLSVLCLVQKFSHGTFKKCDLPRVKTMFALFRAKNVTVKVENILETSALWVNLYANRWHIMPSFVALTSENVIEFDFPFVFLHCLTFFSRIGDSRVVTPLEIVRESWRVVSTTLYLLVSVLITTMAIPGKSRPFLRRFSEGALFLLAAVLANAAAQPSQVRRLSIIRKLILLLWFLGMLPVSTYFSSELTSILAMGRPGNRIDTLEELEDALDSIKVAPCVAEKTGPHYELTEAAEAAPQHSLSHKLHLAFARHGDGALLVKDAHACLQCAQRRDRVCYGSLKWISFTLLDKYKNVRPFVEHFRMQPIGFPMPKNLEVYKPIRRLLLASEEQELFNYRKSNSEYADADAETKFDISGLFALLAVLYAGCCFVLVVEVLVARCLRRAPLNRQTEGQCSFPSRVSKSS